MTYWPVALPASTNDISDVAVAVCKYGNNLHTAIFYRDEHGQLRVLDLRIDGSICSEPLQPQHRFAWAVPAIHPDLRASIRVLCQHLSKTPPEVFYGLKYVPSAFIADGDSVCVSLGGDTIGFTCATFVLAIFDSLGLSLVNHDTWPTRHEDADEQRNLAQWAAQSLRRGRPFGVAEYVMERNAADIPCVRYRCHEVLASCVVQTRPASFEDAATAGEAIRRWILATDSRHRGEEPNG
jgi:hypothetical protein